MLSESLDHNWKNKQFLCVLQKQDIFGEQNQILKNCNTYPLTQKHFMQLDWISNENGLHILTDSKSLLCILVSSDSLQENIELMRESQLLKQPLLGKKNELAQHYGWNYVPTQDSKKHILNAVNEDCIQKKFTKIDRYERFFGSS